MEREDLGKILDEHVVRHEEVKFDNLINLIYPFIIRNEYGEDIDECYLLNMMDGVILPEDSNSMRLFFCHLFDWEEIEECDDNEGYEGYDEESLNHKYEKISDEWYDHCDKNKIWDIYVKLNSKE